MKEYIAVIHKDEDSDFSLFFPDVPGCFSAGSTMEEARINAAEALAGHVAILVEDGQEVAEPSTLDEIRNHEDVEDPVAFFAVPLVAVKQKPERRNISALPSEWEAIDEAAEGVKMTRSAYMVRAAIEKAQAEA